MAARATPRAPKTARRSTSTRRTVTARRSTARKPITRRTVAKKPATRRTVTKRPSTARRTATVRRVPAKKPMASKRSIARRSAPTKVKRIQSARRLGIMSYGPHSHLKKISTARRVIPSAPPKKKVGTISHYFNKIGVAVIETSHRMQAGERVSIEGATTNFKQKVRSMQHNNKRVGIATRGKSIGLKVNHKVRRKDIVYRL